MLVPYPIPSPIPNSHSILTPAYTTRQKPQTSTMPLSNPISYKKNISLCTPTNLPPKPKPIITHHTETHPSIRCQRMAGSATALATQASETPSRPLQTSDFLESTLTVLRKRDAPLYHPLGCVSSRVAGSMTPQGGVC